MKKKDLLFVNDFLQGAGGLMQAKIGAQNAINLFEFLSKLTKSLSDISEYYKKNSVKSNGKREIPKDKKEEWTKLIDEEIELDYKLELKLIGTEFDGNVTLKQLEPLLILGIVEIK